MKVHTSFSPKHEYKTPYVLLMQCKSEASSPKSLLFLGSPRKLSDFGFEGGSYVWGTPRKEQVPRTDTSAKTIRVYTDASSAISVREDSSCFLEFVCA